MAENQVNTLLPVSSGAEHILDIVCSCILHKLPNIQKNVPNNQPHKVCKITTIQQLTHKGTTYTNNKDIITTLNSYFSSVSKTLTRNLTSHTKYQHYLKNPNTHSFYLEPVDQSEIIKII